MPPKGSRLPSLSIRAPKRHDARVPGVPTISVLLDVGSQLREAVLRRAAGLEVRSAETEARVQAQAPSRVETLASDAVSDPALAIDRIDHVVEEPRSNP
jgi:hypothetical protein